jgi:hypothetical protein
MKNSVNRPWNATRRKDNEKATGSKESVTGKRWKGNRKEVQCYRKKMEGQQEGSTLLLGKDGKATGGMTVLLKKDGKATGRKDSITGKR